MSNTRILCIFAIAMIVCAFGFMRMSGEISRLETEQKQSAAALKTLADDQAKSQQIMKDWAEGRANMDDMQRAVEHAVKEAIRNDPAYANWRGQVLPDSFVPFSGGLRIDSPGPTP